MNKKLIKDFLLKEDYKSLIELAKNKHSQTLKYTQMYLFEDINSLLRWRAIDGLGLLAREYAVEELEAYRNLLRRFLWAMNDESGNVPWSSPEAMGSIIANKPDLFGEYTPMLITNALDNPMCHRGMLWAAGQIGKVKSSLVLPFLSKIKPFLFDSEPDLRGYALWALGQVESKEILPELDRFNNDKSKIYIYRKGKLELVEIAALLEETRMKFEKLS